MVSTSVVDQAPSIHVPVSGGARIPSFGDKRVRVVAHGDPRIPGSSDSHCWAAQEHDGPTFVVIGPSATDDQLGRASKRFGLYIGDLLSVRDMSKAQNGDNDTVRFAA